MAASEASPPSVARLLAAGQKGETLDFVPVYGPCRATDVPGKGRGLLAVAHVPVGGLLLLEPALACAATYPELALELRALVMDNGGDGGLFGQLLSLSCWGRPPTSVPPVPSGCGAEEDDFMKRQAPRTDAAAYESAQQLLETQEASSGPAGEDFAAQLLRRLEAAARANAFRSALDALGALAWHALSAAEQRAIAEADPSRMPVSRLWLFLRASLINHSETPNANWIVAGSAILVRAARAIEPGEEISFSYWPDIDAADAVNSGMLEGFGMTADLVGNAEELALSEEQAATLVALKRAPFGVASRLGNAGSAAGDVAAVFDSAAVALTEELSTAEKTLPKQLRAFLEPRFFQAQLTLQQGAILIARGDARGEKLQELAALRFRAALKAFPHPWGKRVLLRLLFALKGILRAAPAEMLGEVGEGLDFSVQLAKQARLPPADLLPELERAVEDAFGDAALLPAVLAKCGLADASRTGAKG